MVATLKKFSYNKTLAASSLENFDFRTITETSKYVPFANLTIFNIGNTDLKVYINESSEYVPIPQGVFLSFENEQVNTLRIENTSSTTSATYYFTLDSKPSTEQLLQQILERL